MNEATPLPRPLLSKVKIVPEKSLMDLAHSQKAGDITFYVRDRNHELLEVTMRDLKALLALV